MEYWENDRSPLLKFYHRHWPAFLLVLLGLLLFFSANGQLLITDPVESNYALTAGEMLVSGGWLSPRIYGNYWYDKPWLFYGELLGNRDSHTLFHMKLCRGLLLSLSIAALWYGPMGTAPWQCLPERVHRGPQHPPGHRIRTSPEQYLVVLFPDFPHRLFSLESKSALALEKIRKNPAAPFPPPHLLAESG